MSLRPDRPKSTRRTRPALRLKSLYCDVFGSPAGGEVLGDLLKRARFLSVTTQPSDATLSAFNDGRRSLVLEILAQMRWTEADAVRFSQERASESLGEDDEV